MFPSLSSVGNLRWRGPKAGQPGTMRLENNGRPQGALDLHIRKAETYDQAQVRELQTLLIPEPHPYSYAKNIELLDARNFVAVQERKVVGYISTLVSGREIEGPHLWQRMKPYLAFMGVVRELQHQGIGAALLSRALEEVFATTVAEHFYLECDTTPAGFYLKQGFSQMTPEQVQREFGLAPRSQVWRIARGQ